MQLKKTNLLFIGMLSLFFLTISPHELNAQSRHVKQREKELGQKAEEREAEEAAQQEEGRKRHLSIQNKSTIKEMKKYKKKSKQYNKNKKPLFRRRK